MRSEDENTNQMSVETKEKVVYCSCGQKLEVGWNFCPSCKRKNTDELVEVKNNEQDEQLVQDNSIIYILIFVIGIVCSWCFYNPLGYLIALVSIVTGKIKCPNSVAIKVLFWLMIIFLIFEIILIVWLMITCANVIGSCPD